jgi:hypothetical protein
MSFFSAKSQMKIAAEAEVWMKANLVRAVTIYSVVIV